MIRLFDLEDLTKEELLWYLWSLLAWYLAVLNGAEAIREDVDDRVLKELYERISNES